MLGKNFKTSSLQHVVSKHVFGAPQVWPCIDDSQELTKYNIHL